MGRRKGSKNKKTMLAQKGAASSDSVQLIACLEQRLNFLEQKVSNMVSDREIKHSELLETIHAGICHLTTKVDLIENSLSPLMFIEKPKVQGHFNGEESKTIDEEGQQEN